MNANANTELAAVAATQSAVDAMAVVTLSPEKYATEVYEPFKAQLADAIDSVRAVEYDIKTTAGMAVAVKCRALFRDMRVAADKERKARKEPITKIGKLLESGFDQVEERITPLEELFDADIKAEEARKEAEKAAKIAAERARVEAIEARIQRIRNVPLGVVGQSSGVIREARDAVRDLVIGEELYGEQAYQDKAMEARSEAFNALEAAFDAAEKAEEAARAAAEAARLEAARLEAERAELARQRAENERIANEQAAERQRLANLQAAQEAEQRRIAEQAAANLRQEREAQEEAMRIERAKQVAAQAEIDRARNELAEQQAAHASAIAKQQADAQREADHAEAIEMNAALDTVKPRLAAIEVPTFTQPDDLARHKANFANFEQRHRESVEAYAASHPDCPELTNEDIIEWGAECGLPLAELVTRLEAFTVYARAELLV